MYCTTTTATTALVVVAYLMSCFLLLFIVTQTSSVVGVISMWSRPCNYLLCNLGHDFVYPITPEKKGEKLQSRTRTFNFKDLRQLYTVANPRVLTSLLRKRYFNAPSWTTSPTYWAVSCTHKFERIKWKLPDRHNEFISLFSNYYGCGTVTDALV